MHGTLTHPARPLVPVFAAAGAPSAPPAAGGAGSASPAPPTNVAPKRLRRSNGSRAEAVAVAIIGATGYAGGELVRILAGHPFVRIAGLVGREGTSEPLATRQPHLSSAGLAIGDAVPADAEAVFIALPHGAAAELVPPLLDRGVAVVDLGADFRLHDPADYPTWYGFDHPHADLLGRAVYGLPEVHRSELAAADPGGALVASPGCYPTAAILATAPLARAGLVGDLVVDAKSGVSGAGRDPKPELTFSEVNESVKAYGVGGHRHVAEMDQELRALAGAGTVFEPVEFVPHLVPMTRGILATCHVRTRRPIEQAELDDLYAEAYAGEPFVRVVADPPATKHVLGSNEARIHARVLPRSGRVLVVAAIDNLVKGAAGQAVQAFNLVFGLPETSGLTALPVAP